MWNWCKTVTITRRKELLKMGVKLLLITDNQLTKIEKKDIDDLLLTLFMNDAVLLMWLPILLLMFFATIISILALTTLHQSSFINANALPHTLQQAPHSQLLAIDHRKIGQHHLVVSNNEHECWHPTSDVETSQNVEDNQWQSLQAFYLHHHNNFG